MNDNRLPARALNHTRKAKQRMNSEKWIDNIKEVFRDLGLTQTIDATKDRVKWRYCVTTSSSAAG